jgi:Cohesin domain
MIGRTILEAASVLSLILGTSIACGQTLSINAPATNPSLGSTFVINVQANGVSDLFAFQFDIAFNPAVLHAVSVAEGPFLPTGGTTAFVPGTIDNVGGHIAFNADTLIGAIPGVTGGGVLARITFQAQNTPGASPLSLSNIIFLSSSLSNITATVQNGSVSIGSGPAPPTSTPAPPTVLLMIIGGIGLCCYRLWERRDFLRRPRL